MTKIPMKGQSDKIKTRMIKCPECGTIQKLGTDCTICKAPLYAPYLEEINGRLTLRKFEERDNG